MDFPENIFMIKITIITNFMSFRFRIINMKNVNLCLFLVLSTILALGSAQYYGSFGRNVLIRPQESAFPFQNTQFQNTAFQNTLQSRSDAGPLLTRVNSDPSQNIRLASTQISSGSEAFSFDIFRVSIKSNCAPEKLNYIQASAFRLSQMLLKIMTQTSLSHHFRFGV